MKPPDRNRGGRRDFQVLLGMGAVLVVPFVLTLMTIKESRPLINDLSASPHGYTWSLSLFIVPVAVLAAWVSLRRHAPVQKKAFWLTGGSLAVCGILLDVCSA